MSSIGPNSAGTGANFGSSGVAWTNPGNITASDNARTNANGSVTATKTLLATNFGFSVPTDAVINGIVVEIEKQQTLTGASDTFKDLSVKLALSSSPTGSSRADASAWPFFSESYVSYGSSSDTWGLTLTPTDVNTSGFGVGIQAADDFGSSFNANVDHIRITVYYTVIVPGVRRRLPARSAVFDVPFERSW